MQFVLQCHTDKQASLIPSFPNFQTSEPTRDSPPAMEPMETEEMLTIEDDDTLSLSGFSGMYKVKVVLLRPLMTAIAQSLISMLNVYVSTM